MSFIVSVIVKLFFQSVQFNSRLKVFKSISTTLQFGRMTELTMIVPWMLVNSKSVSKLFQ